MKIYYISGIVGGILLFLIMLLLGSCSSCVTQNKYIKESENNAEDKHIVRYYLSDDYANSPVGLLYVDEGEEFVISVNTYKEGYRFLGWFNSMNLAIATQYADINGYSLEKVQEDILLYPIYDKE